MSHPRDTFWDIIKGVSILLVVLGHSINYGNGADYLKNELFYDNILFKFIYSFHMPIFMLVSGYLFYNTLSRKSSTTIIRSRCRLLLLPILSFAVIYKFPIFLSTLEGEVSPHFFVHDFFSFTFMGYHLWFLWSIFLNTLIVLFIEKLRITQYAYILIWACFLLIPNHVLNGLYSFMFPYFVFGLLLHQYEDKYCWRNDKRLLLVSALTFAVMLFFYNKETYIYTTGQSILKTNGLHQLLVDLHRLIIGLSGSIFVIISLDYLYHLFSKSSLLNYLSSLGLNSMGIYCFHHIFFWQYIKHCTIKIHITSFSLILTIAAFIGALAFSLVTTYIAKKTTLTRILFLGGR